MLHTHKFFRAPILSIAVIMTRKHFFGLGHSMLELMLFSNLELLPMTLSSHIFHDPSLKGTSPSHSGKSGSQMPVRRHHLEKRPLRGSALRLQLLRSEARRDCAWSCRLRQVLGQSRCSACRSRLVTAVIRVCKSIDGPKQNIFALSTICLSSGRTLLACSGL